MDKKYYLVNVIRYGCIPVAAHSEAEAMDIANHQCTQSVSWSDDWEPTEANEVDYDASESYAEEYEWK